MVDHGACYCRCAYFLSQSDLDAKPPKSAWKAWAYDNDTHYFGYADSGACTLMHVTHIPMRAHSHISFMFQHCSSLQVLALVSLIVNPLESLETNSLFCLPKFDCSPQSDPGRLERGKQPERSREFVEVLLRRPILFLGTMLLFFSAHTPPFSSFPFFPY